MITALAMPDEPNHDETSVQRNYKFIIDVDDLLDFLAERGYRLKTEPNAAPPAELAPPAVRKARKTRRAVTPRGRRDVLRHRRLHGGTLAEIAASTGYSPSSVWNILNGKA